MITHKILDDMNKVDCNSGVKLGAISASDIPAIAQRLRDSIKFDLGDASEIIHTQSKTFTPASPENIPFGTSCFQMHMGKAYLPENDIHNYLTLLILDFSDSKFLVNCFIGLKLIPDNFFVEKGKGIRVAYEEEDRAKAHVSLGLMVTKMAIDLLACSNVKTINNPPSRLKQSRVKKGKTPIFTHKTLHISNTRMSGESKGGTHASPRVHLRRGHIRRLPNGEATWVQPCVVGDKAKGIVTKDYKVSL